MRQRVLLTGATGFVGRHVYPALKKAGYEVVCASRKPDVASRRFPNREWVFLDVERSDSFQAALSGCDSVLYLVHGMSDKGDYEKRELGAAFRLAQMAWEANVQRIVYLGGVVPQGQLSKHLRSRLRTGEILRNGGVSTVELRAGMIVGAGSESWNIVRDLAMRLPLMILPKWLSYLSEPIGIDDVVSALLFALEMPNDKDGCYDIPGPDLLTGSEILKRVAKLRGMEPFTINVPLLTPKLSSYWLRLITRANFQVAHQIVQGMTGHLVASGPLLWDRMPDYKRVSFEEAALRALGHEPKGTLATRLLEWGIQKVSPKSKPLV